MAITVHSGYAQDGYAGSGQPTVEVKGQEGAIVHASSQDNTVDKTTPVDKSR